MHSRRHRAQALDPAPGESAGATIGGPGSTDRRVDDSPAFTFKTSSDDFDMLTALPGVRPAPYLASRGMTWVQHSARPGIAVPMLRDLIRESHRRVSLGLTKKLQRELGLNQPVRA